MVYDPYIKQFINNRKIVESKYNIKLSKAKRIVAKNILMVMYQNYISPFRRVKHFLISIG